MTWNVLRRIHWPKVARDSVLFGIGVAGLVRELVAPSNTSERLLIWVGVCTSPFLIRADEKRRERNGNGNGRSEKEPSP